MERDRLRAPVGADGGDGPRSAAAAGARGRRDRAGRRLRHRPRDRRDRRAAPARPRDRRRRLAGDGGGGARGGCRTRSTSSRPTCWSSSSTSRSTRSSRPRRSTGSATTTRCSPACAAALKPGGRLVAQCGGAGNVAAVKAAGFQLAAREPFAEHLGDWPGRLELRLAGGDRGAPAPARLHRRVVLEHARGRRPRRPRGLPGDDLPRLVPRAPARGPARAVHRRRASSSSARR